MLLYRLPEAFLVKMMNPFLLDSVAEGGLGLSTETVGIVYGTIGVAALTLGGILGGIAASFVVLVSAGYGKESGGSVAGVAAGTAVSLASGNMSTVLSGYALGGLVSGIFAVFGKLG